MQAAVTAGIRVRLIFATTDHVAAPATGAPGITTETVRGRHGWLLAEPQRFADLVTTSRDPMAITG
jgi:hypothetical protein